MSKYYAGIGSRETPKHIQTIMRHIGSYLSTKNWTLRSGAASGADQAFETGVDRVNGTKEIYLPWRNYNHNISAFNPTMYPFSDEEIAFTARHHPAWDKCSPAAKILHQRNTRIMLGMEALHGLEVIAVGFVICWTNEGKMIGGTGQALRIANTLGIPIINLGSANNTNELEKLILEIETLEASFGTN
jgi:hypothetical protein